MEGQCAQYFIAGQYAQYFIEGQCAQYVWQVSVLSIL